MSQRIVHLSSVHPANDTRIYLKECVSLSRAGFEVVLVARRPEIKFDPEPIQFVEFRAPINRAARMLLGSVRMLKLALSIKGDLYHFHDPELIPVGLMLKALGRPVIYDVHEDVPSQVMSKTWIPKPLRKAVSLSVFLVHRLAGHVFDRIIVAREDAAAAFRKFDPVVVQNFSILTEFNGGGEPKEDFESGVKRVTYVGGISRIRGIQEMIEAVRLVAQNHEIKLDLAGPFQPKSLQLELEKLEGWENVNYVGWADRRQMATMLADATAGLLLFHPAPNHLTSYPNKLFEYMSAGLPVIASDFDYWRQFITIPQTGFLVDPQNPREIADAIEWMISHPSKASEMGRRGKEMVIERFNWESEAEKLVFTYQSILESRHSNLDND